MFLSSIYKKTIGDKAIIGDDANTDEYNVGFSKTLPTDVLRFASPWIGWVFFFL